MEKEILPEHENVETFVEYLMAEERTMFSFSEADLVAQAMKVATYKVIEGLKSFGFTYEGRSEPKKVRGFTSNSHDRWQACRSHGGSGWEQITGFAGQKG